MSLVSSADSRLYVCVVIHPYRLDYKEDCDAAIFSFIDFFSAAIITMRMAMSDLLHYRSTKMKGCAVTPSPDIHLNLDPVQAPSKSYCMTVVRDLY